jgi:hypothetical protein
MLWPAHDSPHPPKLSTTIAGEYRTGARSDAVAESGRAVTLAIRRAHIGGVTKLDEDYLDLGHGVTRLIVRIDTNAVVRIRSHLVRVLTTLGGL